MKPMIQKIANAVDRYSLQAFTGAIVGVVTAGVIYGLGYAASVISGAAQVGYAVSTFTALIGVPVLFERLYKGSFTSDYHERNDKTYAKQAKVFRAVAAMATVLGISFAFNQHAFKNTPAKAKTPTAEMTKSGVIIKSPAPPEQSLRK